MSNVSITYGEYKNFGNCVTLKNNFAALVATLDIGPRILKYALIGRENMLFEDIDRACKESEQSMYDYYGENATWYTYGGYRLWQSPEYMPETYYPDNEPLECKEINNGVILTAPVQKQNNLQFSLQIVLSENSSDVFVKGNCKNCGDASKEMALWALTVMTKNGVETIKMNDDKPRFLPNRKIVLWPYSNMEDSRVHFGKDYITLKQDSNATVPFKIGLNRITESQYIVNGCKYVKKFNFKNATYPDFDVNFETYTNNHILEFETLSPLVTLSTGDTVSIDEVWSLSVAD